MLRCTSGGEKMYVRKLVEPIKDNWLEPEMTLQEAVVRLSRASHKGRTVQGMVVLENGTKLVGVLSIKDIIRAIIPSYMEDILRGFTWEGMFEAHVKRVKNVKVKDIMSRNVITVKVDDSLIRCADLMIDNSLQRIPVVDDLGRVIGILYIHDLYEKISDLMSSAKE